MPTVLENGFYVVSPSRTYTWAASSLEEKILWMNSINNLLARSMEAARSRATMMVGARAPQRPS